MKSFIQRNRNFWAGFQPKKSNRKILIEAPSISMITHVNAIFAIVLNQAASLMPIWLRSTNYDVELLKSYMVTAEYTDIPKVSLIDKLKLWLIAIWKFLIMYTTQDILAFSYNSVKYGDIAYDSYLSQQQVGTIKKIDKNMLRIIYSCIHRHNDIRRVLNSDAFSAVLVSHQVGINSGIMLRTALRYGYKGYLRCGHHRATLQCFTRLDEVYDYEYKPFPEDIDTTIATLGPDLDRIYNSVFSIQVSGKGSKDGIYAFSPKNKYYDDRQSFMDDFGIDPLKKNVFVMLHAFTDHPHSHFRWMIFKDYYDWFKETLAFARQYPRVNWIFKQHPSIRFYPMKDVSFEKIFSNVPENIIYINEDNQIDTRSLVCCADVVLTCAGSAGFELPAMAGIPSIVAGDNHYANLGFALEPRTKEKYFNILMNIDNIIRLTPEQQKRARAAYLYIYQFSRVSISAAFPISVAEQKDKNQKNWYWKKVNKLYEINGRLINDEIRNYIGKVAQPEFRRLNSLSELKPLRYEIL